MKIAEYNEMMAYLLRPATGDRVSFYKGSLVTEDGPNKGKYRVKFSYNQDYGNPKFKGVQYGTKEEIEKLIADRKIIADKSYQTGVDKAAQLQIDKKNKEIKNTIDSFIKKGDYENFKTKPYDSQLKRKLPSGNVRQSTGGRVPTKTFQYIRDALDAGTDSDLFKDLMKATGKTEQELINFKKQLPEKGVIDVEQRAKSAEESFPEERKLTEEQKQEAEKKVQAKRKDRLQKTTGKAKFIKAKNISGEKDFAFHHIKQIGGEAPLTNKDVKVIDKVMNSELSPYNTKLNDIADAISKKITESFQAMDAKQENKALKLLEEVDILNTQAEGIVKSAHDKLPEKFKPLIGYNKVYARTDEYGFPLDDKVRIEPIGGGLKKGERAKPLTQYSRKDVQALQKEIDKQVRILEIKKDIPSLKSGDEIEQPEKSKIRNLYDSFNQKYISSKPIVQKFSSKVPGSAAVLAPYDAAMMLLSGAPAYDALASGASYLTNDPLIGRAVNIPLALREMTNYGDEKEMFQRATERREGIESVLENLPSKFKSYINENRGIDDETEEFVP